MKLQPTRRAFENYLLLGFEYASKKKLNKEGKVLLKKISLIDDSVLIIDDILDNSKIRNGEPCLYLKEGKNKALAKAKKYKLESIQAINNLMKILKTKTTFKKIVHKKISQFFKSIDGGGKIKFRIN